MIAGIRALCFMVVIVMAAMSASAGTVIIHGPAHHTSGADYQVAKGFVYLNDAYAGTAFKIGVYDSGGNLLGSSNTGTVPGSGFPQWVEVSFTSGPTLSSGATVYISVHGDSYLNVRMEASPANVMQFNAATWSTTPATINPAGDTGSANAEYCLYVTNAASTVLAGKTVTGDCTGNGTTGTGSDNMYYELGYTVATL